MNRALALTVLAGSFALSAAAVSAQDWNPDPSHFENEAESTSTQAVAPIVQPPPAKAKPKQSRMARLAEYGNRNGWRFQVVASAILNDRATMDRVRFTHIKSGKGVQEFNLGGSMLGGGFEAVTLVPWKKLHLHRKRSH